MEFNPITSQEQFDEMVKDRLGRQKEQHQRELEQLKAQYADYDTLKGESDGLKNQIAELTGQLKTANDDIAAKLASIAEKDSQLQTYALQAVKQQVMTEMSLPMNAIDFITGADEDSIRKSAEQLKGVIGSQFSAPLANPDIVAANETNSALRKLAQTIKS